MTGALLKIWRGEPTLFRAFWLHFYLGYSFVLGIVALLVKPLELVGRLDEGKIALAIVWVLYVILASVGVWRAASRYEGFWLWPALARIVTVIAVLLALSVATGQLLA